MKRRKIFEKRGRRQNWRHLGDKKFEFPLVENKSVVGLVVSGPGPELGFPNFIRCSRTTPSNFSLLYFFVNFMSLADNMHIINEAAISKHPKIDPIKIKI